MIITTRLKRSLQAAGVQVPSSQEDWLRWLDGQLRKMMNEAITYEGDAKVWAHARKMKKSMEQCLENSRNHWSNIYLDEALDAASALEERLHHLRRETLARAKLRIELFTARGAEQYWAFESTHGKITKVTSQFDYFIGRGLGEFMNHLRLWGFSIIRIT